MKKSYIIAGIIGLAMILKFTFIIPRLTRPYPLKPFHSRIAPPGANIGCSVLNDPPVITIISDKRVEIFCEPGLLFQRDILWIIESPSSDSQVLKEYIMELPEFRANSKIQPLGSKLPQKVLDQVQHY